MRYADNLKQNNIYFFKILKHLNKINQNGELKIYHKNTFYIVISEKFC